MRKHRDVLHVTSVLLFVATLLMLLYYLNRTGDYSTKPRFVTTQPFSASRLKDFRRDWLRQRRARVDWQGMMESCKDDMAWDPVKWDKMHRSDADTSEIVSWDIRPAGEFSKIFIQSKTSDNRTKLIRGDTWRVHVRGHSRVPVTVFDHRNGTYEALFLIMEPGRYQLMIYLDYSLCDGFRDPPPDWFIRGNSGGRCQNLSILGRPLDHLLLQSFKHWLNFTVAEAKLISSLTDKLKGLDYRSHTCKHLWDGFGQWKNDKWEPLLEESDYNSSLMPPEGHSKSGTLWFYGDSLTKNIFDSVVKLPLCTKVYSRCRLSYNWIYPVRGVGRVQNLPDDDLDIQTDKIIGYIVDVLRKPEMQSDNSTLLLNIGLHMGATVNFTTYQRFIEDLINALKKNALNSRGESGVSKYKASVIWKTTTAVRHKDRKKAIVFLTTQRILLFNAYATSAICKAGFDVIDVYPMTDSNPEALKDHAHYTKLDGFYNTVATSLEKQKLKRRNPRD